MLSVGLLVYSRLLAAKYLESQKLFWTVEVVSTPPFTLCKGQLYINLDLEGLCLYPVLTLVDLFTFSEPLCK